MSNRRTNPRPTKSRSPQKQDDVPTEETLAEIATLMPDSTLGQFCSDNKMNEDFCIKSPIIQARLSNIEAVKSTGHSPFKSRSAGPALVELVGTEHFSEIMSALDDQGFLEAENEVPGIGEAVQENPILAIRSNSLRGVTTQPSMRRSSETAVAANGSPVRNGVATNGSPVRNGARSAGTLPKTKSPPRTPDEILLTGDVKVDAEELAHFSPAELQEYIAEDPHVATVVKSPSYAQARRSLSGARTTPGNGSVSGSVRRSTSPIRSARRSTSGVEGYPARSFPLEGELEEPILVTPQLVRNGSVPLVIPSLITGSIREPSLRSGSRAGTTRPGTARTGTMRDETTEAGTARAGTVRADTARAGTARTGTVGAGTARAGTARAGTARSRSPSPARVSTQVSARVSPRKSMMKEDEDEEDIYQLECKVLRKPRYG